MDLGGHLDFTRRTRAGILSTRVRDATIGVVAVGALPLGFLVKLGFVSSKYTPAGLHAAEASCVSSSSLSAFSAAIVRLFGPVRCLLLALLRSLTYWMGRMGLIQLFILFGLGFARCVGILAYCPEEEPWIFRMLDLFSRGAQGQGPVHLFLTSAAEVGFAWNGGARGRVRSSLPHLRMMTGPTQHVYSSLLKAWRYRVSAKLAEREGFLGAEFVDFNGSLQQLTSSHLRERDNMLLRAILCGGVWNGFLLGQAKKEDVPCRFCGKRDGYGQLIWSAGDRDPWAASFRHLAGCNVERCLDRLLGC